MKFSLSVDLTRSDPSINMQEVASNTMELVQMADEGGCRAAARVGQGGRLN